MATILEIARHAGIPADQVVRVVSGEPVNEDAARRVREAIALLGAPPYPRAASGVSGAKPVRSPAPPSVDGEPEPGLLERIAHVTAELEDRLPDQVGSVVYEAVRVEVRPVAEHMAAMDALFREVLGGLHRLAAEVAAERRDRVDDLALQVELMRASWTSVDRRLGRLERMVERQAKQPEDPRAGGARVVRIDARERA
jgi:hypothetical protein